MNPEQSIKVQLNITGTIATLNAEHTQLFFYHNFPRRPSQHDYRLGLGILSSILKRGLLLTPELAHAPRYGNLEPKIFIQQRVSFTALTPSELRQHADFFGEFSLEYDTSVLRSFGVLPALYLTPPIPGAPLLDPAGAATLRLLVQSRELFETLHRWRETGTEEQKALVNSLLPTVQSSSDVVIQELKYALQTLCNLYYPTENLDHVGLLHYYEQREWKIVPGFAIGGAWIYPELDDDAREELLSLNPRFFEFVLAPETRRIDKCLTFPGVAGKNIVKAARRLLVPDSVVADAAKIVASSGLSISVEPFSNVTG